MLTPLAPTRNQVVSQKVEHASSTRGALASLSLTMLLSSLGTSIANVALPTLASAFEASFHEVQWVVLAYLLAITTVIVSVGRLGDIMGRRRLMLVGLGVFTLSSVLCGLAPTLDLLVAARAAQGLGAAVMMALTLALVGEAVPKEKTGSAMGLLGTMSAVGTALGPALGGGLIAGFGWPSIFLINLPLGLLALVLSVRSLPLDRPALANNRASLDPGGTLALGLTLAAYALAMTPSRGRFGLQNLTLLLAALAALAVFLQVEARAASPLVRLATLRDPLVRGSLAMSSLVTTVVMATLVVGPFYLAGALGLGAARVGLVMSAGPLVAALAGLPAGRLVDQFGAPRMTLAGLVGMALGTAALPIIPTGFGVPGYLAPLVVVTAGYALFQAANNTGLMAAAEPDQRGVISGLLNLSRNLGLITGASIMGSVFSLTSGASEGGIARSEEMAAGMRATFLVAAALVFAALGIARASQAMARPAASARRRTNSLAPECSSC